MNRLNRRQALRVAAAGTAILATLRRLPAEGDDPVSAIDAHTHFYDPTRPEGVPWPDKNDELLYRRVLPDEFRRIARPHKVAGTIVVEASPWVEDNRWLLDLAAREPLIVGVVGRLDPAGEDFAVHLKRFAADPLFRGIRIGHAELRDGLGRARFRRNLGLLAERDLALDVNGGTELPADVARLSRALPGLRVVINHAANLKIDGRAVPAEWLKGMRAAAAGEHVYCKVSALVEGTGKSDGTAPAGVDFYRPVLDALWDTFGPDRLVYGSNWPVSERFAPYATVHEIVRAYFTGRGREALDKVLRANAVAAYKPAAGS